MMGTPGRARWSRRGQSAAAVAAMALAAVTLSVGCTTPSPVVVQPPEGFASYDLSQRRTDADLAPTRHLAMSPEGVLFRVRTTPNEPRQTLSFWTEALRTQLTREGYTFLDEAELDSAVGTVSVLRWSAPVGNADWVYVTALGATGDSLVIAEAAGAVDEFGEYQTALRASLEALAPAGSTVPAAEDS